MPVYCLNEKIVDVCLPVHVGEMDVAIALITNGADVNAKNRLNETPLHIIAKSGNT